MTKQKRRLFRSVIASGVACLILFTPSVALGWGSAGHQIMAQIASRKLNSKARVQVKILLSSKVQLGLPYSVPDLVTVSTWADEIKSLKGYPQEFNELHFIANQFPTAGAVPTPNIVTALKDNVKILQTSTDMEAKAQAIRFIIHFVGDIHQPLHCAVRVDDANPKGDQGGNRVSILVADSSGRLRPDRLHIYWDEGLNTFAGSTASIAARIEKAFPDRQETDPFNFQGWSDESFRLARDVAYAGIPSGSDSKSPIRVTATYKAKAQTVVNQQIAKSGYRLARLLNAIWPER